MFLKSKFSYLAKMAQCTFSCKLSIQKCKMYCHIVMSYYFRKQKTITRHELKVDSEAITYQ